jgi:predicted nucleic acid-binding protein
MLFLIDSNILVYRFDCRFPDKQSIATRLLRLGIAEGTAKVPYQALLEFVAATTRRRGTADPILPVAAAHREAEEMIAQFDILYPTEQTLRLAIRGAAAYELSWFDANLWAYAEHFGMKEILTEDFENGRLYGSVVARNPFVEISER